MTLSKAENERLKAELKKEQARAGENEQQKWLRGAIRETLEELLDEKFGGTDDEDDEEPKKPSGPNVFDLGSIFGGGKSAKTG